MLLCLPATSRQSKGAKANIFEALTLDAYGQVIIHVTKLWFIGGFRAGTRRNVRIGKNALRHTLVGKLVHGKVSV